MGSKSHPRPNRRRDSSCGPGSQSTFRCRVVDLDRPMIEIARESTPARDRIADGHGGIGSA